MASLFTIAIISYSIGFAHDNNAVITILNEPLISNLSSNITSNIGTSGWSESINESSEAFFSSTISTGDESMEGGGQFKGSLTDLIKSMNSIFKLVRDKVFGGDTSLGILMTALSSFLVFVGIRYIYKTWVGKMPD